MRITLAADIGLRALLVLAGRPAVQRTVTELADELAVSQRHLGKVVQRLAQDGLIETARGRKGGIRISAAGLSANAADILVTIEGERQVVNCTDPPCPLASRDCRLRSVLDRAQDAFLDELRAATIAELGQGA